MTLNCLTLNVLRKKLKKLSPNLEIIGVPENKNENLTTIIENVHKKIGINFDNKKIKKIYRNKSGKNGQKNIIVETDNKQTRDELLDKLRKQKIRLSSTDITDTPKKSPIYINEHLPFSTKKLLSEIKTVKAELNIKFVWIREGKILIRKDENSKVQWIKEFDEISKIN
jgi:hypothetical protein